MLLRYQGELNKARWESWQAPDHIKVWLRTLLHTHSINSSRITLTFLIPDQWVSIWSAYPVSQLLWKKNKIISDVSLGSRKHTHNPTGAENRGRREETSSWGSLCVGTITLLGLYSFVGCLIWIWSLYFLGWKSKLHSRWALFYPVLFHLLDLLSNPILYNPILVLFHLVLTWATYSPSPVGATVVTSDLVSECIGFLCLCSWESDTVTATSSGCHQCFPACKEVCWANSCAPPTSVQLCSFVLNSPIEVFLNTLSLGCYFSTPTTTLQRLRGYCCQVYNNGAWGAGSHFILHTLGNFFIIGLFLFPVEVLVNCKSQAALQKVLTLHVSCSFPLCIPNPLL